MNQCAPSALVLAVVLTFGCSASNNAAGSGVHGGSGAGNSGGATSGAGTTGSSGVTGSSGGALINADGGPASGGAAGNDGTMSCDGKLTGYIRDFLAADNQDFEPWTTTFPNRYMPLKVDPAATVGMTPTTCPTGRPCLELGIVQPMLDGNRKPIYAKKADGSDSLTTTGQANFDTWFHDGPKNMGMEYPLQFALDPTDPTGKTYKFDSTQLMGAGFFPIDNMLLSPTLPAEGFPHNYSFTFELHTLFTYNKGQLFNFQGDDDVWVFINNKQVVDLGGIHDIGTQNVNLDTLGLTEGMTYPLDFFFAERHCCASNFVLSTSIAFTQCGVVVK